MAGLINDFNFYSGKNKDMQLRVHFKGPCNELERNKISKLVDSIRDNVFENLEASDAAIIDIDISAEILKEQASSRLVWIQENSQRIAKEIRLLFSQKNGQQESRYKSKCFSIAISKQEAKPFLVKAAEQIVKDILPKPTPIPPDAGSAKVSMAAVPAKPAAVAIPAVNTVAAVAAAINKEAAAVISKSAFPLDRDVKADASRAPVSKINIAQHAHLMANIHGDLFIEATGFEGASSLHAMKYTAAVAKKRVELLKKHAAGSNEVRQLTAFIDQLERGLAVYGDLSYDATQQIPEAVQRAQKALGALKTGEGLIFPGGWAGLPTGHAMYYQIVKTDNTFVFRVFNSGDGIDRHPGYLLYHSVHGADEAQFTENKLSHLEIGNISQERIQNPFFWQAAFEIGTCTRNPTDREPTSYEAADLYDKLFSLLNGDLCKPSQVLDSHLIQPQESGTCAISGLKAVAGVFLSEIVFNRLVHDMELTSLQELYGMLNMQDVDERTCNLLRKSASQLAFTSIQRFESKIISLEELEEINKLAKNILNNVLQEEIYAKQRAEKRAVVLTYPEAADSSFSYIPYSVHDASSKAVAEVSTKHLYGDFYWKPLPEHLLADLQEIKKIFEVNAPDQLVFDRIFERVLKLPVPLDQADGFWQLVPRDHIAGCLSALYVINERLHRLTLPASQVIRRQFFHLKNLAILHKLATRCAFPKEMMQANWGAHINSVRLFDPVLIQQYSDLNAYFASVSKGNGVWIKEPFGATSAIKPRGAVPRNEAEYAYQYFVDHRLEIMKEHAESIEKDIQQLVTVCGQGAFNKDDEFYATLCLLRGFLPRLYMFLKISYIYLQYSLHNKKNASGTFYNLALQEKRLFVWLDFMPADLIGPATDHEQHYQALEKIYNRGTANETFESYRKEVVLNSDVRKMIQHHLPHQEGHALLSLAQPALEEGDDSSPELRIIRTLDYFRDRILRLEDHNILCFFRQMIFSDKTLEVFLQKNPLLLKRLIVFMQKGYQYFNEQGRITGAVNILYLTNMLCERLRPLAKKNAIIKTVLQRFEKEGVDSIHHQGVRDCLWNQMKASSSMQEKSAIHRQLVYSYMQDPEEIAKVLSEIVASLAFMQLVPPKHSIGHLDDAIRNISQLDPFLKEAAKNPIILTAIAKKSAEYLGLGISNWENLQWDTSKYPLCKTVIENIPYELDLVKFTLKAADAPVVSLPSAILQSAFFLKHFPKHQPAVAKLSNGMYEFVDEKGLPARVNAEGIIQRQFKKSGPWYQYIDGNHLRKSIKSRILIEKRTHWQSCNSLEVFLCLPGTSEITHVIKPAEKAGACILVDVRYPNQRLLVDFAHPLYAGLSQCENIEDIHIWVTDKGSLPARMEMPRLGLTFQVETCKAPHEKVGKLRAKCDQITGFWLADKQHVSALGSFRNYLVLENAEGCIKVMIPRKQIQGLRRGGLTSSIQLEKEFPDNPSGRLPPYFLYTLNAKEEIIPAHEAGHLFHAYLAYGQGRYREAQLSFRNQARKLKKYTTRELQNFDWISTLQKELSDNDPKSCAVYLTAMALQLTNRIVHGGKGIDEVRLSAVYCRYLRLLPHMGELRLLKEEERVIAKYISGKRGFSTDKAVVRRLQTIDSTVPLDEEIDRSINSPNNRENFANTNSLGRYLKHQILNSKAVEDNAVYHENFLSVSKAPEFILKRLYQMAKKLETADNNAQQKFAFECQAIGAFQKNLETKQMCYFAAIVAMMPASFPSWEELVKDADSAASDLIKQVAVKAANLYETLKKNTAEGQAGSNQTQAEQTAVEKDVAAGPVITIPKPATIPLSQTQYPVLLPPLITGQLLAQSAVKIVSSKQILQKEGLGKIDIEFQDEINKLQRSNNKLCKQLLELANKGIESNAALETREQGAKHIAAQIAGQVSQFAIENIAQELGYAFLRNDTKDLKRRNPHLDDRDVEQLRLMLVNYYEHLTAEQTLLRQEKALGVLSSYLKADPKEDAEVDRLIEKAVQELSSQPMHSAKEHPKEHLAFLVFEANTDLSLRKDQIDCILRLIQSDFSIEQMMMGAGKSKVILPIIALLKADGKSLPIIITPSPLFDTAAQDLSKSVWDAFNRKIHTLHFDRNTEFTSEKLNGIYDYLSGIKSQRECLMMTSKSLHCLSLKFKSALVASIENPKDNDLNEKIIVLQKILKLIKTDGRAIIDEPHLVLDARMQVNFADGRKMAIDKNRRQVTGLIYKQIFSQAFYKMMDTLPSQELALTDQLYHEVAKPFIQEYVLAEEPFKSYMESLKDTEKRSINAYLQNVGNDAVEKFVKESPLAESFALLKEQLQHILPITLCKRYCVEYGPSQKRMKNGISSVLAIPYDGNNSPVEASEFRSPDALMNLTIQMLWHKGIPASEIERCLKQLQADARAEGGSLEKTVAFQAFQELCGNDLRDIKFLDFKMVDCERIAARINASRANKTPDLFLNYIVDHVLTTIRVHELEYTSNAYDLVNMFASGIGFTGTPWNSDTYAEVLRKQTKKRPEEDAAAIKIIAGKIAQDKAGLRVMAHNTYPGKLADLIRPDDDLLIDAGAALNGYPNETVANDILKLLTQRRLPKKGVVFYLKNALVVLEKTDTGVQIVPFKSCILKPNELFTYYDQLHAAGSDIVQHPLARGTLTVGKSSTLQDTVQGAFRLRELSKKQGLSVAVTPEADIILRNSAKLGKNHAVTFEHVVVFLKFNQESQLQMHLRIAVKQKIDSVVRQVISRHSVMTEDYNKVSAVIPPHRLLVSQNKMNIWERYGTQEKMAPKETVIKEMIEAVLGQFQWSQAVREAIVAGITVELGGILNLLPKELASRSMGNHDIETEVERDKESEKEIEQEAAGMAQERDLMAADAHHQLKKWWPDYTAPPKIFNAATYSPASNPFIQALSDNFEKHKVIASFAPVVEGLIVTHNRQASSTAGLHQISQIPQYVLYIRNKADGKMKLMLLEVFSDCAFFWKALSKEIRDRWFLDKNPQVELCMCDLEGGTIQDDGTVDVNNPGNAFMWALKDQGVELRVRAKLALGELSFAKEEMPYLEKMMKIHGKEIAEYYRMHIFRMYPQKVDASRNSPLAKII